jgi:hypothetical protein
MLMLLRPFLNIVTSALVFTSLAAATAAQERNLPEEVRALAVVCSSGASVEFQGELEGGINRLFGKVLAAEGELEVSKNETDFLNSFEDERLRLEARGVYNDCVLDAIQIIYNLKRDHSLESSDSRLLVPDGLVRIRSGARFALGVGDTIGMDEGGTVSVYRTSKSCSRPYVRISNNGRSKSNALDLSSNLNIPDRDNCWITLYGMRSFGDDETCAFSFLYKCK